MRPDMSKVVIERPRIGHAMSRGKRNNFTRTRERLSADAVANEAAEYDEATDGRCAPLMVPAASAKTRVRERQEKEFSDLLGPLRGYLEKQIGRPWNKVHSEMSATLDSRSVTGRHIWTHVWQEVELHPRIVDGQVYSARYHYVRPQLYVDPATGVLMQTKVPKWRHSQKSRAFVNRLHDLKIHPVNAEDAVRYRIDGLTVWRRERGVWSLYRFEHVPQRVHLIPARYAWENGKVREIITPAGFACVSAKQASQREIKDHWKLLSTSPF